MTLLIGFAIFLAAMTALGVGSLLGGRPLRGVCGGRGCGGCAGDHEGRS